MLTLKKVAITGGVASGKTTVCQVFRELGAFVVNADEIVHELLISHSNLGRQIIQQFGSEIDRDGRIDRKVLAEKVFHDPQQLKRLEEILHPAVLRKIQELYVGACSARSYALFVVEIPLLFEIQGESFYDYVVAVLADEQIACRRFEQAGYKSSDYYQRMKRQLSPQQKSKRSDYTFRNNGSFEDLKKQVVAFYQSIIKQKP